jgi:hypothetical protein
MRLLTYYCVPDSRIGCGCMEHLNNRTTIQTAAILSGRIRGRRCHARNDHHFSSSAPLIPSPRCAAKPQLAGRSDDHLVPGIRQLAHTGSRKQGPNKPQHTNYRVYRLHVHFDDFRHYNFDQFSKFHDVNVGAHLLFEHHRFRHGSSRSLAKFVSANGLSSFHGCRPPSYSTGS